MIIDCKECGVKFNTETVDKCPCCNFDKTGEFLPKGKQEMDKFLNNESHRIRNQIKSIRGRRMVDPMWGAQKRNYEDKRLFKLKNAI